MDLSPREEAYYSAHQLTLEEALSSAVHDAIREEAADPIEGVILALQRHKTVSSKPRPALGGDRSWRASTWLGSLSHDDGSGGRVGLLAEKVSQMLIPEGCTTTELEVMQGLGKLPSDELQSTLRQRVTSSPALEDLVNWLSGALRQLASGQGSSENLRDRFLQDGAGLLSFAGLETFFGGLEKQVDLTCTLIDIDARRSPCVATVRSYGTRSVRSLTQHCELHL